MRAPGEQRLPTVVTGFRVPGSPLSPVPGLRFPFLLLMAHCSLLIALSACAPQTTTPQSQSTSLTLIEGGTVEGRIVRASGLQLALPSAPVAIARNADLIYAAYPFQLLIYQNGFVQNTLPLPGTPTFIRAKPQVLVGFADRVFVPGRGSVGYAVRDAVNTKNGIFWLDEKGVKFENQQLAEGSYSFLAASDRFVYAMGREALRLQDSLRIALPDTPLAAVVLTDLYVLVKDGIHHLTLEGLRLGFVAGNFSGLESDGERLYTLQDGRLVTLTLDLRILAIGDGLGAISSTLGFRVNNDSLRSLPGSGFRVFPCPLSPVPCPLFLLPATRHPLPAGVAP